jgi:hypothetical protein
MDVMSPRTQRATSRPVHPLLFAAFPVLFLVAHNRDVTSPSEALGPLAITLACVLALQLVAGRLTRAPRKVAAALSGLSVLFFSYGHVWTLLHGRDIAGVRVNDVALTATWSLIACIVVAAVVRTRRPLHDLTRVLNAVAVVLVMTTLITVGTDSLGGGAVAHADVSNDLGLVRPAKPRDVYYLIFDRYADAETLRTHLGFDNTPFINALEQRGFDITPGSRANYQNTHMSLASSLNMQHLDVLLRGVHRPSKDLQPIFDLIGRSAVAKAFKSMGYRYVHVGSWASFTSSSPIADINLKPVETSELTRALYGSTALSPLLRRGGVATGDENETQEAATRGALRALDTAMDVRGPKFVFAHFILPHPPYVFDRDGNYRPEQQRDGNVNGYLEQVRFANSQIERIVGQLVDKPADEQPIIVIQADEGPYPRLGTHFPASWANEPPGDVRVKFGILNAYYLPGPRSEFTEYPSITPVNTFRMIFNRYFGADLATLPDASYATADSRKDAYTLVPLGDLVRGTPSAFAGR